MKYRRIYDESGILIGYENEKARIELYYYDADGSYGNYKKDYIVPAIKEVAGFCRFSTLRDAKAAIEKYL